MTICKGTSFRARLTASLTPHHNLDLRNTEPHMLLSIAPTVFVEAFNAMGTEDNREVLLGGASFFVGDLLKWTLPSVLLALCSAIDREG